LPRSNKPPAEKQLTVTSFQEVKNKELIPGYLNGITGVYQTPQVYYVKDADVEEFDKGFPPKEKLKLPGQIF